MSKIKKRQFTADASGYDVLGNLVFGAFLWVQAFTMMAELKAITTVNAIFIWGAHVLAFVLLLAVNALISFESIMPFFSMSFAVGDAVYKKKKNSKRGKDGVRCHKPLRNTHTHTRTCFKKKLFEKKKKKNEDNAVLFIPIVAFALEKVKKI